MKTEITIDELLAIARKLEFQEKPVKQLRLYETNPEIGCSFCNNRGYFEGANGGYTPCPECRVRRK